MVGRRAAMMLRLALILPLLALASSAHAQSPAPSAPPAGPLGTIAGQVIDAATGDPIIEAGVEVLGVATQIRTDLDGRFSVKVPVGTYQVRFFAPLYQGARLEKVVVEPNKTATADVPLHPEGQKNVEVVEVVAQAAKAAEATQLIKRQKAPTVSDNISAETIKKSPDSNAAEVVKRVPAVTIKDNKFIFVRGLGERYSSAILEGSRLPSPDPERRVVPLDLFPADFIDAIDIIKTYTPDLPGDFSGGLADINLLDFPQQLTYGLSVSTSGNSQTTFQDFATYKGSHYDYFGFGGDYRKIPSGIPDVAFTPDGKRVQFPGSQREFFGREFKNIWDPETVTAPVDFDTSFQIGDRWGPLGARLAATYKTEYRTRHDQTERQFLNTGTLQDPVQTVGDDFKFDESTFETRLGAVFTAAYDISPDHRLSFRSLLDRNSDDTVEQGLGTIEQTGREPASSTQFIYKQEELAYGPLAGTHHFPGLDVDWRSAFSRTTQNVPDQRIVVREDAGSGLAFTDDANGGSRVFQDLTEYLSDSQIDFTVPFTTGLPFTDVWSGLPAKLKFGPAYLYRSRSSELRIFRFIATPGSSLDLTQPTEDILQPGNIGGGSNAFPISFDETTQPQNLFDATHEIAALYAMAELPIVKDRLRLIAGARGEYSYMQLKGHFLDTTGAPLDLVVKNDLTPLPGVNLVYSPRSDMNVRAAWSQTVSRPEFRELSPAVFPEPRGLRSQVGNPFLEQTNVDSYDLRWEWFFAPAELVSLSGFYKHIDKPIEQAVLISGSAPQDTFSQNKNGRLEGFEFEGRKNLGFLHPKLGNFNFLTNVTYVHSEVTATVTPANSVSAAITRTRPLQGQADYVVNAALEYTHPDWGTVRLLYNTVGPHITAVQDANGLPDIVAGRRDELDLVCLTQIHPWGVPLNLKLSVENLLNDNYPTTVGGVVQEDYRTGVTASFGIAYSY